MAVESPRQRIALVTGGAGFGEEIARRLLRDGFKVYVGAPAIHTILGLFGTGAVPVALDTSREDDVIAVLDRIHKEDGGIDILMNCTGVFLCGGANDVPSPEAFHRFERDLSGLTRLIKLLLPGMLERGSGRIVNISPMVGIEKAALVGPCDAAWRALEGWSDCLRIEAAPFGIEVELVEPDVESTGCETPPAGFAVDATGDDVAATGPIAKPCQKPYEHGRVFDPDDVAAVVSQVVGAPGPKAQ
jgi:NAD(P)-dependent dehydrogenase (short-subunit alcohol dehydrogenase family)